MVCTDGWIDHTQKITPHGYIVSQADDWEHDWAWWASYLKAKGLQLGVYYNPLWATLSAVSNPSVTVVGRPDVKVADIVNADDYFDGGGLLQWVDTTRDGAEEYVKGYVAYFRELGATFLRIDFLAYYETGFDQNDGTVGVNHGREGYVRALQWMREAAGDMQLSLVLPNLFDHGSAERQYGDLMRIDNDASFGTWFNLSGGRQTWQPEWSQWNNPFLGFTGFADVSGRGQVTLDGDPLIMRTFTRDEERQSAINLFTMAGAAIAITDQVDTIGDNAHVFQNREVLALRKAGLVGKPVFNNSHGFDYDPTSRDPERWIGQLPDGSWVVALFNREDVPGHQVDRLRRRPRFQRPGRGARPLGAPGPGLHDQLSGDPRAPRLGAPVGPAAPVLPTSRPTSAPGPGRPGSRTPSPAMRAWATSRVSTPRGAAWPSPWRSRKPAAAGSSAMWPTPPGAPSTLTVRALDPETGHVHGTATLRVPSASAWTSWRTVSVTLTMAAGTNLVVCSVESSAQGGVNLDYLALA